MNKIKCKNNCDTREIQYIKSVSILAVSIIVASPDLDRYRKKSFLLV